MRGAKVVIARSAYSLDLKTCSMLVELDVANPRLALAPGMHAEVQWPVSRAQTSLFVPTTAVVRTAERQFVVRVRNGAAEWVDISWGEVSGDVIEVFGNFVRATRSFGEATTKFVPEQRSWRRSRRGEQCRT